MRREVAMRHARRPFVALLLSLSLSGARLRSAESPAAQPLLPQGTIELNDNGAWSWFMDERAIVDAGRLIVGSVRASGRSQGEDLAGSGNVELSVLDLETRQQRRIVLHEHLEPDDHDSPGLLVLPDGRYLAAYTKHGAERRMYWRISSRPADPYAWREEGSFETPGKDARADNVTYANPFRLATEHGRIFLFHRGLGLEPNYLVSDDGARSWRYGGHLLKGRGGYAPYLKYASDGIATIHFVATEDHPRNFDNSLYHGFVQEGVVHRSDGKAVAPLSTSVETALNAWDLTRVFQGDKDHVAWMSDLQLDASGRPVVLFTVQRDGAGLPRGQGGADHRFHYARWDGREWLVHEIAYAGLRLYPGEDDYTGLGAIDPLDTATVVISTDAEPASGASLVSRSDGQRHHELFIGRTRDGGASWRWEALTRDSREDNLRPLIPIWKDPRLALVWMRGSYRAYGGEWTTRAMAALVDRPLSAGTRGRP
jgi:hypothetical protein